MSLSIQDFLGYECFGNFEFLSDTFASSAEVYVSLMGNRIVTIRGYSGEMTLDEVTEKIHDRIRKKLHAGKLTVIDRRDCLNIVERLKKLYAKTDFQIENIFYLSIPPEQSFSQKLVVEPYNTKTGETDSQLKKLVLTFTKEEYERAFPNRLGIKLSQTIVAAEELVHQKARELKLREIEESYPRRSVLPRKVTYDQSLLGQVMTLGNFDDESDALNAALVEYVETHQPLKVIGCDGGTIEYTDEI